MDEMIRKPDANPILFAVLNLFLWSCVGYFVMGQTKKGIISVIAFWVLIWCFGLGIIVSIVTAIDAYKLGQKLQAGEAIGVNENGLPFLNAIFK